MQHSSVYTIAFAALLCVVCSIVVASSAVGLHDRQEQNKLIDQQKKVLAVVGLLPEGKAPSDEEVTRLFQERLEPRIVALETGEYVEGMDPARLRPGQGRQGPRHQPRGRAEPGARPARAGPTR